MREQDAAGAAGHDACLAPALSDDDAVEVLSEEQPDKETEPTADKVHRKSHTRSILQTEVPKERKDPLQLPDLPHAIITKYKLRLSNGQSNPGPIHLTDKELPITLP